MSEFFSLLSDTTGMPGKRLVSPGPSQSAGTSTRLVELVNTASGKSILCIERDGRICGLRVLTPLSTSSWPTRSGIVLVDSGGPGQQQAFALDSR